MTSTAASGLSGKRSDAPKGQGNKRSLHRRRRATLGAVTGILVKAITAVTVLGSVKMALAYLGSERFAMWTMISSLMAMLTFADLGIANGLTSAIAMSAATDDRCKIQRLISSAFFLLIAVSALILVLYFILLPHLDWRQIFNISSPSALHECGKAVTVCLLLFALNLPLGITQRIQSGYQENHISNLFVIPGGLISLAGIYLSIRMNLGLSYLCGFLMSGPVIGSLANSLYVFGFRRPWAVPQLRFVNLYSVRRVAGAGVGFAALQVVSVAGSQTDGLVLAHVIGPIAVTIYAVPARLYQFLVSLLSATLVNLWPAYADAMACGDRQWARSVLCKSIGLSVCLNGAAGALLLAFGNIILKYWIGPGFRVPLNLWVALTAYILINAITLPLCSFLNGLQIIAPQVAFLVPGLVLNILSSIFLTRWIGIAGVVWGTIIYQFFALLIPGFWLAHRGLSESSQPILIKTSTLDAV